MSGEMVRLDSRVTSLGAFRIVGEKGINYSPMGVDADSQERRHRAVEHIFRMAAACGLVDKHHDDDYAVLDGYDDSGDIVADYGIPTARGFRFLYRKLGWRIDKGVSR